MRQAGAIWLALLAGWPCAALAQGQDVPTVISPLRVETDHNNVNLINGRTSIEPPVLSVPAAPNLRFDRAQNAAPYVVGRIAQGELGELREESYSVHTGAAASESFRCIDYDCHSVTGTGSTFMPNSRTYRQSGSGAVWQFNLRHFHTPLVPGQDRQLQYYAQGASYPNGEQITFSYDEATLPGDTLGRIFYRPNRVESNFGYFILIAYQPGALGSMGWNSPATATLFATVAPTTPLRQLTYSGNTITDSGDTVADPSDDRVVICTGCTNQLGADLEVTAGTVQLPGETTVSLQVAANPSAPVVQSVSEDGVQWTYAYGNLRFSMPANGWLYDSLTITGPNGFQNVYTLTAIQNRNVLTGVADSLQRATTYQFDGSYRPTRITSPEGNAVSVAYDEFGNLTTRTQHARPGTLADISEHLDYPTTGLPGACNVHCWRPLRHRDELGRQTDYAYNTSGQLTEQTDPADASGIRRRTIVEYALSPAGISRRSVVRVCGVGTTCGTNQEHRTEYDYLGNTPLVTAERRVDPVSGTVLAILHSYDVHGRLISTDGPLPGTDDKIFYRYDVHGRRTWEIGAADGNGVRLATRTAYRDSDDKPLFSESGTIPNPDSTALTVLRRTDLAYDARRNPVRETVSAGGTAYTLTERSFDDRGRQLCEAVRMNAAAAPGDACVPGVPDASGPDRITKNVWDAAASACSFALASAARWRAPRRPGPTISTARSRP